MKAQRVQCGACGWRTTRTWESCGCYEVCSHSGFGTCNKCGTNLYQPETIRQWRENDRQAEQWWAEHGEEEMRRLFPNTSAKAEVA